MCLPELFPYSAGRLVCTELILRELVDGLQKRNSDFTFIYRTRIKCHRCSAETDVKQGHGVKGDEDNVDNEWMRVRMESHDSSRRLETMRQSKVDVLEVNEGQLQRNQ